MKDVWLKVANQWQVFVINNFFKCYGTCWGLNFANKNLLQTLELFWKLTCRELKRRWTSHLKFQLRKNKVLRFKNSPQASRGGVKISTSRPKFWLRIQRPNRRIRVSSMKVASEDQKVTSHKQVLDQVSWSIYWRIRLKEGGNDHFALCNIS